MDDDEPLPRKTYPPWLDLLTPQQRAWRIKELGKGRQPDAYIEKQLIEAGKWIGQPEGNA